MGYMCHNAIIVTGFDGSIDKARARALEIFYETADGPFEEIIADVTAITGDTVNGYKSFMVAPDGSKEGWPHSDSGDDARRVFIEYLGTTYLNWVEVQYGDDEGVTKIVHHSDEETEQ